MRDLSELARASSWNRAVRVFLKEQSLIFLNNYKPFAYGADELSRNSLQQLLYGGLADIGTVNDERGFPRNAEHVGYRRMGLRVIPLVSHTGLDGIVTWLHWIGRNISFRFSLLRAEGT